MTNCIGIIILQRLICKTFVQHRSYLKYSFIYFCILINALFLIGCSSTQNEEVINTNGTQCHEKFAKKAYNKPYTIKGKKHHPQKHYEYDQIGIASYYGGGDVFHGRKTSNGEVFDMNRLSAAHKTLPIPCEVLVTNLENKRSLVLKINDRGPFVGDRIIDLSRKAARLLGFENKGLAKVRVQTLVPQSVMLANNMARGKNSPVPSHGEIMLVQNDRQDSYKSQVIAPPTIKVDKSSQTTGTQRQSMGLQSVAYSPPQSMDQLISRYQDDADIQRAHLPVNNASNPKSEKTASLLPTVYSAAQNTRGVGAKNITLEVGTYKHLAQAKKVAAQLKTIDPKLPVQLQSLTLGQKPLYRVVVGPVKHTASTSKLLQQLSAKIISPAR